jgi:hypothetical protein
MRIRKGSLLEHVGVACRRQPGLLFLCSAMQFLSIYGVPCIERNVSIYRNGSFESAKSRAGEKAIAGSDLLLSHTSHPFGQEREDS